MAIKAFQVRMRYYITAALRILRRDSIALLAGLLGSLAAVLVMGLFRLWWGTPTPPELVGERLLPLMSANQFVALLIQFQPHSKTGPLGLALLSQCIIGIVLGPAYALAVRALEKKQTPSGTATTARSWFPHVIGWAVAGSFAASMELIAIALFWPVLPEGLFGDPIDIARLLTIAALGLTFAAYAVVLAMAYQIFRHVWGDWAGIVPDTSEDLGEAVEPGVASPHEPVVISRREALQTAGVTLGLIVVGAWAGDRLINAYLGRSNLAYEGRGTSGLLTSPVTPNTDFYVVSKNVLDPTVEAGRWRLELTGLVRRERSWTYEEVQQLPAETRAVTLECISNEVGGNLLSTARWRGVTLETLLEPGRRHRSSSRQACRVLCRGRVCHQPATGSAAGGAHPAGVADEWKRTARPAWVSPARHRARPVRRAERQVGDTRRHYRSRIQGILSEPGLERGAA